MNISAKIILLTVLTVALAVLNLIAGAVDIPLQDVAGALMGAEETEDITRFIIIESRLPQMLTAILAGSALATCGLLLQTSFRNPLAGPSVFGIDSGAALGVAVVMLGSSAIGTDISISPIVAAFAGAAVVMAIIIMFAAKVRSAVMLLIIGIMTGYMASAITSLLNFMATEEGVHSYLVWGMGNFSGVSMQQMGLYACTTVAGLTGAVLLVKPLNALLLGNDYARSLGINVRKARFLILAATGLLIAVTTAYCGPVSFIGLAVPHMARLVLRTGDHRVLLPSTMLMGAMVALACNLLCVLPGDKGIIPLSAVTPLIGGPVIIYVIFRKK